MDPLNDDELNQFLRQWEAPGAPPGSGEEAVTHVPWWRWLLTGSIPLPVPVGIAAAALIAVWLYFNAADTRPLPEPVGVSLAGFQPVAHLESRIIAEGP